jgi:thiol:disulfide interchange protein DsbD
MATFLRLFPRGLALAALLVVLAMMLAPMQARAAAQAATENVTATLLSEREALMPGTRNWVLVHQKIRPGWHTYWINPGDSGLPISLEWALPAGFSAGPIEWPAPHYFEVGGLANHGYGDEVGLLVALDVPEAAAGTEARVAVKADWLVCETICVPETVDLSITLPVGRKGQETPVSFDAMPLFAAARASLPTAVDGAAFAVSGRTLSLALPAPELAGEPKAHFFPLKAGVVEAAAPQSARVVDGRLVLDLAAPATAPDRIEGVVTVEGNPRRAFAVAATPGAVPAPVSGASEGAGDLGLVRAIALAFLGGLLLNLMPCVLPVLSIKALALVGHDHDTPWKLRAHGLAYGAGVLATFAVVGGTVLALRAGGAAIGWGFQLQSPTVVAALAYLLFGVGLSLAGVLQVGAGRLAGIGQNLAGQSGLWGAFFTGALAVLVATPCTAPFMGAALGYAFVASAPAALGTFLALGIGLAAPFVILAFSPALVRLLPRPGLWMERLRQGLAFPMFGSAVWLVWVLGRQAGPDAVLAVLAGCVLIAFAAWALSEARAGHGGVWVMLARTFAIVALVGALALARMPETAAAPAAAPSAAWQPYDADRLAALRAEGRPVFVNATAAWCLTCLVNEKVALASAEVQAAFTENNVALVEADWTRQDPAITALLAAHGRSGVPLYLYFPPGGGAPIVLPQVLTPAIVVEAVSAR